MNHRAVPSLVGQPFFVVNTRIFGKDPITIGLHELNVPTTSAAIAWKLATMVENLEHQCGRLSTIVENLEHQCGRLSTAVDNPEHQCGRLSTIIATPTARTPALLPNSNFYTGGKSNW